VLVVVRRRRHFLPVPFSASMHNHDRCQSVAVVCSNTHEDH
jgi:hypothetical protein